MKLQLDQDTLVKEIPVTPLCYQCELPINGISISGVYGVLHPGACADRATYELQLERATSDMEYEDA